MIFVSYVLIFIQLFIRIYFVYKLSKFKLSAWYIYLLNPLIDILYMLIASALKDIPYDYVTLMLLNSLPDIFMACFGYIMFKKHLDDYPKKLVLFSNNGVWLILTLVVFATLYILYSLFLHFVPVYDVSWDFDIYLLFWMVALYSGLVMVARGYFLGLLVLGVYTICSTFAIFYYNEADLLELSIKNLSTLTGICNLLAYILCCFIFINSYVKYLKLKP
ncbi:hypothetical protein [Francisella frigiditurris]|uniref:Putative membrane protein n=1 Tax=Francisella frigiditurris TaxID=1542390 RepID=A0A1J0KV16_9GAMM|nr:hypothetical protein [Francisella frigiditurris]APC97601.1 putative membrane protein [Francisella frigiditurris]